MKKQDEKILADLLKRCAFANKGALSGEDIEFVMAAIAYLLKMRPNLVPGNPLSVREMLCLTLLATGKNPEQCADLLGISVKSVMTYEQRLRKKLGAKNRTNAFYIAQVRGYISIII